MAGDEMLQTFQSNTSLNSLNSTKSEHSTKSHIKMPKIFKRKKKKSKEPFSHIAAGLVPTSALASAVPQSPKKVKDIRSRSPSPVAIALLSIPQLVQAIVGDVKPVLSSASKESEPTPRREVPKPPEEECSDPEYEKIDDVKARQGDNVDGRKIEPPYATVNKPKKQQQDLQQQGSSRYQQATDRDYRDDDRDEHSEYIDDDEEDYSEDEYDDGRTPRNEEGRTPRGRSGRTPRNEEDEDEYSEEKNHYQGSVWSDGSPLNHRSRQLIDGDSEEEEDEEWDDAKRSNRDSFSSRSDDHSDDQSESDSQKAPPPPRPAPLIAVAHFDEDDSKVTSINEEVTTFNGEDEITSVSDMEDDLMSSQNSRGLALRKKRSSDGSASEFDGSPALGCNMSQKNNRLQQNMSGVPSPKPTPKPRRRGSLRSDSSGDEIAKSPLVKSKFVVSLPPSPVVTTLPPKSPHSPGRGPSVLPIEPPASFKTSKDNLSSAGDSAGKRREMTEEEMANNYLAYEQDRIQANPLGVEVVDDNGNIGEGESNLLRTTNSLMQSGELVFNTGGSYDGGGTVKSKSNSLGDSLKAGSLGDSMNSTFSTFSSSKFISETMLLQKIGEGKQRYDDEMRAEEKEEELKQAKEKENEKKKKERGKKKKKVVSEEVRD